VVVEVAGPRVERLLSSLLSPDPPPRESRRCGRIGPGSLLSNGMRSRGVSLGVAGCCTPLLYGHRGYSAHTEPLHPQHSDSAACTGAGAYASLVSVVVVSRTGWHRLCAATPSFDPRTATKPPRRSGVWAGMPALNRRTDDLKSGRGCSDICEDEDAWAAAMAYDQYRGSLGSYKLRPGNGAL
jgi:hypothetical protein